MQKLLSHEGVQQIFKKGIWLPQNSPHYPHYQETEFCRLGYPFLNYQIIYFTHASLLFTERAFVLLFSEFFKLCETKNINLVEYFVIDKHLFEQIFRKFEPDIFLYEFLNSGDPLYLDHFQATF